jgi:hypothetical protein
MVPEPQAIGRVSYTLLIGYRSPFDGVAKGLLIGYLEIHSLLGIITLMTGDMPCGQASPS